MSPAVIGRAGAHGAPRALSFEEVVVRREPYFGGLVVFFADRAAPDGYLESWAPGDSALSLASWEYYSDCTRVPTELAREFLGIHGLGIPAPPLESFEPGKYRPLAALGRSRLKDIWGLGYDDDEGLERILREEEGGHDAE